jgi:hypothetical protein
VLPNFAADLNPIEEALVALLVFLAIAMIGVNFPKYGKPLMVIVIAGLAAKSYEAVAK